MEKYSATKKQHSETTDDDEEVPAPAMKRTLMRNNVSDILADSVQIKRKENEVRQWELELRAEEKRQTATLSRTSPYTTASSTATTHNESRYAEWSW